MQNQDLRKVRYSAFHQGNIDVKYHSQTEGHFHRWAEEVFYDEGAYHPRTVAIVEDAKTGEVFSVLPSHLQFIS